jgi:hypothetical protein
MSYPAAIVEISFTDGPYVVSPTWVDVTGYVRELTTRRGRTDDLSDFGAGTASITLDNRDRRFDPLNTAGPYYGQLTPRRQIRVRAANTVAGVTTTHDIFRGYVSGWPCRITDAGFDSTVALECFDALGLLAQEEIPDDLGDSYIRTLNPLHYWPLTDPLDAVDYKAVKLQNYGQSKKPLLPVGTFRTANVDGLADGLLDTSITIAETQITNAGWHLQEPRVDTSGVGFGNASLSLWFQQPDLENFILIQWGTSTFSDVRYDIRAASSLKGLVVQVWTGFVTRIFQNANLRLDLSVPHHYAQTTTLAGAIRVWVDGVELTMTEVTNVSTFVDRKQIFIWYTGRMQQAVMTDTILTDQTLKDIYQLGANRLAETTAARFDRIINSYTPFPPALTSFSVNATSVVSAFTMGGPDVATELELVSDSEGGHLFVTKAGVVKMTGRNDFATGASLTSQATIGTTGITIGTELDYSIDAENIRNQLTMGFAGDGSIEVTDTASVAAYGVAGGSWSTQLSTPEQAENLGDFLVGFSKDPRVVTSPVEVNVSANAADWNTVLGLELLNRVTLTVQPKTGPVITLPQLVQSVEHRVIPGEWRTTLNGSVRFTNPFIIGVSLLGGPDLLL